MAAVWTSRTDISPATTGSWQDADLDSSVAGIPAGAGVAIIEIRSTTAEYNVGLRNNGSTDNRTNTIYADGTGNSRQWALCPFDSNHILEAWRGNANVTFWIHGYIQSGVTGYTNALDRSITNTAAWTDLTALPAGATGGIYEIVLSTNDQWGLRMNGSTDNRLAFAFMHAWFAVGSDASRLVEGRISVTSVDFFELGYFTADVTWNTNPVDRSLAATGAWTDLTALTAGATGGIIEVFLTSDTTYRGIRRNGDTFDPGTDAFPCGWRHGMAISEADASRLVEGYIGSANADFFEVGVFLAASGITVTIGQVTETDTAQAITWAPKRRLVNQVTETDLAQGIARLKTRAVGQVVETDLAQALTARKQRVLGQVVETDVAQVITRAGVAVPVGQVTETDLAQSIAWLVRRLLNQAQEADIAQPMTRRKTVSVGQTLEANLAQGLFPRKSRLLGQVIEVDLAQSIAWAPKTRVVQQVLETDLAQAISVFVPAAPPVWAVETGFAGAWAVETGAVGAYAPDAAVGGSWIPEGPLPT